MAIHSSAKKIGSLFLKSYVNDRKNLLVVDVGSADINGSLKDYLDNSNNYIGVDLEKNKNVDIVLDDPYSLPFDNNSIDVVLCSSVFEHSEFFWLIFLEVMRTLKPNGIFYLNAPSHGEYHAFPNDSWRFYPDSGISLKNWGVKNNFNCDLVESFVLKNEYEGWDDFVAIFIKDKRYLNKYKLRTIGLSIKNAVNCRVLGKKYKEISGWNSSLFQILRFLYRKILNK